MSCEDARQDYVRKLNAYDEAWESLRSASEEYIGGLDSSPRPIGVEEVEELVRLQKEGHRRRDEYHEAFDRYVEAHRQHRD